MYVTAIIAAGGRGERFGVAGLKQLFEIGGRPILERSVTAFLQHSAVHEVIVALPRELVNDSPAYLHGTAKPLRVVDGGARRQDSVANAFRAASAKTEIVVIHDAARPFVTADLITRTIAAAAESGAALAAIQARDTVKRTSGSAEAGRYRDVVETLARESIYLAQTPQAFRSNVLADALAFTDDATDEAALAERAGYTVRIVEGEPSNIKITTREDLAMAEAIEHRRVRAEAAQGAESDPVAWASRTASVRTGIGYDVHRLVVGRPLILGGVTVPFDRGLAGHSDADAVCHAITDAILGAAAAGDIGRHFPDSDPIWKGASSLDLLRRAAEVVRATGLEVGNVDVTVVAERPKLAPQIDAMRANVARALGISSDRVSIKGKTNEGIGELGRGEAIAVHAIALVWSR